MDLIKEILLFAEKHCWNKEGVDIAVSVLPEKCKSVKKHELEGHVHLAWEHGLLEVDMLGKLQVIRLTWKGHDYLDEIRDRESSKTESGT